VRRLGGKKNSVVRGKAHQRLGRVDLPSGRVDGGSKGGLPSSLPKGRRPKIPKGEHLKSGWGSKRRKPGQFKSKSKVKGCYRVLRRG